jgi:glycine cleavage system aminomethyltransferase T
VTSALDFLSVDAVERDGRFHPVARSPMERRLRDAGAEFEEREGWLVATRVPGEERRRLAIRDLTHLHRVREAEDGMVIEYGAEPTTLRWDGNGDSVGATSDLSAGYAALGIEGPGARTVLQRITELDLTGLPKAGAVAHTRACVLEDGPESYRLVFEQEYGHYLWEVVVDAAEPLGGGPVGTP